MDRQRVKALISELLKEVGEDPEREGLKKTPERVARTLEYLTQGYHQDLTTLINGAVFSSSSNNMVLVRDIEVYSLCEHHLLPFFGRCHIGYVARGRVLGVSKLARIVDFYARRLQIQENLTGQIAKAVMEAAAPEGVGVVMECRHMCMMMRGVSKQNSVMGTSCLLGSFRKNGATRLEFLNLIRRESV
ncbi:MAG: GTP cyclohydrolase I FolE [Spirochaetales bacterium]|jgi:GTP cyclohydrolase I|nr:GTP cyclohydrolase I FolE [Spirochaetales bacterium]